MILTLIAILVSLIFPRLLAIILWVFTDWFHGVFHTWLWPILGFIFLPTTMLWYSAVMHWYNGEWTAWRIAVLVIAVLIDLSRNGYTVHKTQTRS